MDLYAEEEYLNKKQTKYVYKLCKNVMKENQD